MTRTKSIALIPQDSFLRRKKRVILAVIAALLATAAVAGALWFFSGMASMGQQLRGLGLSQELTQDIQRIALRFFLVTADSVTVYDYGSSGVPASGAQGQAGTATAIYEIQSASVRISVHAASGESQIQMVAYQRLEDGSPVGHERNGYYQPVYTSTRSFTLEKVQQNTEPPDLSDSSLDRL